MSDLYSTGTRFVGEEISEFNLPYSVTCQGCGVLTEYIDSKPSEFLCERCGCTGGIKDDIDSE